MPRGTVHIESERCKGCALCVAACPQGVLQLDADFNARGYHPATLVENGHSCTGCALCALVCPDVCFTVYRQPAARRTLPPSVQLPAGQVNGARRLQ